MSTRARFCLAIACFVLTSAHSLAQTASTELDRLKLQGEKELANEEWPLAAATFDKAVDLDPKDPFLRASLALASLKGGQFAKAIASYQEWAELQPGLAPSIGLANAYRRVRNYDEARRILEETHIRYKLNCEPLAELGDLDIETQSYDLAIQHLRAALTLNPNDVESRNRLAIAYKEKPDFPAALAQIAKILARDQKNALAYYTRAQIRSDQNQDEKALADVNHVLAIQPDSRLGQLLLGKILVRVAQGQPQSEAVANCTRAIQALEPLAADPSADSQTIYLLSHAYQCAGQADQEQSTLAKFETVSQTERKKKDDQMQVKHLVEQANELAMKNDFQGSLNAANQAVAVDPKCGPAYSQIAKLYYSAGDLEKASEAVTHALEADPYQPDFLFVQGKILEKEEKLDQALASFQRATLVNPKESDAFFEMGVIYQRQGDRPRALAAYKKAAALAPDDPDYARAIAALSRAAASQN